MKSKFILMLFIVCIVFTYIGCTSSSAIENFEITEQVVEQSVPVSAPPAVDIDALFESMLPGPSLASAELPDDIICTDYLGSGLLRIYYKSTDNAKLKLQVLMGDNTIVYNLKGDGSIEDFPLQYGSGEYTARIMQNIKDDEYFAVETATFTVQLKDDNDAFLNSIENVKWDYNKVPIKEVRYLVLNSLVNAKEEKLLFSSTEDLYLYIIENIKYDSGKIYDLLYDYLPDIESTYDTKTGICYDYSSLLAAMLRSINIPTKLVKGYAGYNPDVYHAWNEVYLDGEWFVIDSTKDASGLSDDMIKNPEDYSKVYEY